eukprot:TRINITY_DN9690_c0_g1_i8.p1 TRINITY_DN9690_c0_g1~~TRINITY_DN9690_c0_g1_i8.p1  ORF type:complete len:533 (-),score=138.71 TRINITY_DN9690_c0_g1_i8:119-1717(-)
MLQVHDLEGEPIQVGSRVWYQRCNGDDVIAKVTYIDRQNDTCHLAYVIDDGQQACRRTAIARMFLERPPVFARDEDVSAESRELQKSCPSKWSVTLEQWNMVINECKHNIRYNHIKKNKERDKHVNMHDVNKHFVQPWSVGSGCGLALLLNQQGLDAEIMCSHAWAEDVDQCQEAVNLIAQEEALCVRSGMWFCTFAQYQPEDGVGPSIEFQLDLEPFTSVINSGVGKLIAIHTTTADLYARLWCVLEVDEALRSKDVKVVAAFSSQYLENAKEEYLLMFDVGNSHQQAAKAALGVNTSQAQCSRKDKRRLLKAISKHGGFQRIDEAVAEFRHAKLAPTLLAALGAALQDEDARVRRRAADSLRHLGEHAAPAMPALGAALQDEDEEVRGVAALALGRLGEHAAAAVPALGAALQDKDKDVRERAALALWQLGKHAAPAVPALVAGLQDKDAGVRRVAAEALGYLGEQAAPAVPALGAALQDEDEEVREGAALALCRALQDEDEEVREGAALALGRLGMADLVSMQPPQCLL